MKRFLFSILVVVAVLMIVGTVELINDFEERSKGNISLIRQELRKRYKENMGDDRMLITAAFNRGTKDDKTWITLQIRKDMF